MPAHAATNATKCAAYDVILSALASVKYENCTILVCI